MLNIGVSFISLLKEEVLDQLILYNFLDLVRIITDLTIVTPSYILDLQLFELAQRPNPC